MQRAMQISPLKNKSEMLVEAANLLHDKCLYPAVAHAAYYSCYQMLRYIWLYSMKKSQEELDSNTSQARIGSHEVLLNEVVNFINAKQCKTSREDARCLRNEIPQLKRLRTDADYSDATFDIEKSRNSLDLSNKLMPILKKY
jgi:hypothetical protein